MRLIDADELYLPSEEIISKMIIASAPTVNAIVIPEGATNGDMGEVSDGYHTFNQLYHQRAMLFAALVNLNKNISWKSLKHEDGKYCFDKNGDWFIVGIDTPEGTYTYHYETDKYWNIFDCQVLPIGKHWDGHTEEDVTRLLSLSPTTESKVIKMRDAIFEERESVAKYIKSISKPTGVNFEDLPSIQPKSKTGHWIYKPMKGQFCSECDEPSLWKFNYCPNCGADMREEQICQ